MLRSRDIKDYFEARFLDLKPGKTISFDVYLYFAQNEHLMLWCRSGDLLTDGFLDKYQQRGIGRIWIHREDEEAYNKYLSGEDEKSAVEELLDTPPAATEEEKKSAPVEAAPEKAPEPKTEEGAQIVAKMDEIEKASDELDKKRKAAMIAKEAREVLRETAQAETLAAQKEATAHARKVVEDILDATETESLVNEIWKLADIDPELEHGTNVATYAVILAMAFGRVDRTVISDLALAALIHDIGLSQIPFPVTQRPWSTFSPEMRAVYASHVPAGLALVEAFEPSISPRVKQMISHHHEKFDGSGYPRGLEGFHIDDLAQLVSIADILDSMSSGQWDGTERPLKDTFDTLEKLEKTRTFPEYFNPEVFAAVLRWIRDPNAKSALKPAADIVQQQARGLLKDKAG